MEIISYITFYKSPVGWLKIKTSPEELIAISFVKNTGISSSCQPIIMKQTVKQLTEYFKGNRKVFMIKTNPTGSNFQKNTWKKLEEIEFGNTATYLDIAIKTGSRNNTRAVGLANGKNPIPIIIPCHRIIGINGKLTGYAGGLEAKRWLLQHELKFSAKPNLLF